MNNFDMEKFLSDKRVQAEIERHLWIESEKSGCNIGYEKAKEDWLKRFSATWMQYNMPELVTPKKAVTEDPASKKTAVKKPVAIRRRRAKSYV